MYSFSSLFPTCFPSLYRASFSSFFFFNDTSTTEIYTLSLHDALPICELDDHFIDKLIGADCPGDRGHLHVGRDRKSTRLNSSHPSISYAVFCLKKKKTTLKTNNIPAKRTGSAVCQTARILPDIH